MASDISILLSTYLSDNYIKKYYQNIIELTNAGANLIVAGNSIFKGGAESYEENINALRAPLTKK